MALASKKVVSVGSALVDLLAMADQDWPERQGFKPGGMVEVGAANLRDPFACRNIVRDLPETMEKYGIKDISSIIGGAH